MDQATISQKKLTAATSLFTKLHEEMESAGIESRSLASTKWFLDRVKKIPSVSEIKILKDPVLIDKSKPLPGKMFMFKYMPKHQDTLPYYDKFPLILMIGPAQHGFYGLNLHYLAPKIRARFLDKLMDLASSDFLDVNVKIRMSYNLLNSVSKFKEFRPCFKHYLYKHVKSQVKMVPAPDWEIAIFLPTERFNGQVKTKVWAESKKQFTG